MKKLQTYLSGFLALQVLLAMGLFWSQLHQRAAQQKSEILLTVAPDKVQRLEISSGDKAVTLVKRDGKWLLPDLNSLPVDVTKLNVLLDRLENLKANWPVATTSSAQERFAVAEEKFQKRVRLYGAGKDSKPLQELYIGTSPGFRKVHLRRAGEDAIYAVTLSSFEIPDGADSWMDKQLLAAGPVKAIKGPDYQLSKAGGKWQFGSGDTSVDSAKAADLAGALANLKVIKPADKLPEGEGIKLAVTSDKGDLNYLFSKDKDHFYVSRADQPQTFEVSRQEYDRIAAIRNQQLVRKVVDNAEQTAGKKVETATKEKASAHS
ncbi:DUF4340 domain-containing protein [Microbulbifer hainanensis]|uniref:DUF4340 domain-containing protein n=1 Tax=Microbulbifer hainanensis TaxID=2735675 RepID=UPI00186900A5|nr:DUF4340 domain-containing protein [Microbulbifer hainanensis]